METLLAANRELRKDGKFTTFARIVKTGLDAFQDMSSRYAAFIALCSSALSLPGVSKPQDLLSKPGFEHVLPIRMQHKFFAAEYKQAARAFLPVIAMKSD